MNDRLSKLKTAIKKKELDATLVSSVPNISYLTGFSSFSKDEREAFLFLTSGKQYILTDGRYSEAVKDQVRNFELIEISSTLTFEKALKDLVKKHKTKRLGIEYHNISLAEHKKISRLLNDLNHFTLDGLRVVKSATEISSIEKACRIGDKAFDCILKKIKEGMSEKELAFEIEFFIKKKGADISFPPIVAFGKNSSIPHHKPFHQKLKKNSIVLLDFGAKIDNYCSDMTRTIFFGYANAEYKKIYQTVLEAQKRAIEFLSSTFHSLPSHEKQIKASQVDKVARSYILEKRFPTIPHGLGHGVGHQVHEAPKLSPKSKDKLKTGMVFTIEPGIYIKGFGGVRIEDVVALEKSGPRLLTKSPKDLIIIPTLTK